MRVRAEMSDFAGSDLDLPILAVVPFRVMDPGKVEAVRQWLGMSQAAFADYIGVSTRTVTSWESGKVVKPHRVPAQLTRAIREYDTAHGIIVERDPLEQFTDAQLIAALARRAADRERGA